jgi:competence protein ComEC
MRSQVASLALAAVALGCGGAPWSPPAERVAAHGGGTGSAVEVVDAAPVDAAPAEVFTWQRVRSVADVPTTPPPTGTFRLHMIDVGSGQSLLLQGADFALLYDAGSSDKVEPAARVVDYLKLVLGGSVDAPCKQVAGSLAHVVLSHPHVDHGKFMPEVVRCFRPANVWDAGRMRYLTYHRGMMKAVASTPGTTLHTASAPPDDRVLRMSGRKVALGDGVAWRQFANGDRVPLGVSAAATILNADPSPTYPDANSNSIVLRLQLGTTSALLVGDAESGPRLAPSAPVADLEERLLERHRAALDVDLLQVGHHGSNTSSRLEFLRAITPELALISSGPRVIHGRTLPDLDVLEALATVGARVLRTDTHDAACDVTGRIGGDVGAGGCDSVIVTIRPRPVTRP